MLVSAVTSAVSKNSLVENSRDQAGGEQNHLCFCFSLLWLHFSSAPQGPQGSPLLAEAACAEDPGGSRYSGHPRSLPPTAQVVPTCSELVPVGSLKKLSLMDIVWGLESYFLLCSLQGKGDSAALEHRTCTPFFPPPRPQVQLQHHAVLKLSSPPIS